MRAELILHNARVYTVDPACPWAEAVAVAHGRIEAVGRDPEILDLAGRGTRVLDLAGRLVLPGMTDAHLHFLRLACRRHQVDLAGVRELDEVLGRLARAVDQAGPGEWVLGGGWDESPWGVAPTAAVLDRVAPDTPVALARMDMHTWWVNGAALTRAGITRSTPDPPESRIERDASGHPTGLLREWNAIRLVEAHIPEPAEATLLAWLGETIAEAHRLGLTGIHDLRLEREGAQSLRLFQELRRQGELDLRVHFHLAADYLPEAAALGLEPGFGDDRLWLGHVKAFADGTLGSRTAHMLEPFVGEPDNVGLAVTSPDELWELAVAADRAGFPLAVHAIGDRAVRDVIAVLSEFPSTAPSGRRPPHRIEHVQLIHPDDLPRLARHGIAASVQPVHLLADWQVADRFWGERARLAYAFRSLLDHGACLALGSDAPVAPMDPLLGIHAAVNRQEPGGQPAGGWYPEQRLSVAEAVAGYTLGPARVAGREDVQGSITPGKWADLVVLGRDLFAIPPEEIREVEIALTVFDGRVVHGAL